MADLKPVYLVHGDDNAKIDAWRARVRERAERENGTGGLETHDPLAGSAALAVELQSLTFNAGTRYILADGVEAWKARDVEPLEPVLAGMPPDTVLVLIARGKPVERLVKAVTAAGGDVRAHPAPKSWEMPKWTVERAAAEGLKLDAESARLLVDAVGASPQRLAREVEKLALLAHPANELEPGDLEAMLGAAAATKVYELADALVDGDHRLAVTLADQLTAADERPASLSFPIVRRLREVRQATAMLEQGVPEKDVADRLKQPNWLAKRTVAHAKRSDRESLERALMAFADLERDTRGEGNLDEATAFTLALGRAAAA